MESPVVAVVQRDVLPDGPPGPVRPTEPAPSTARNPAWDPEPLGADEEPEGLVLHGRVLAAGTGAPVAGAGVVTKVGDAATGVDGRFEVAVRLRDGRVRRVEVGADGYRPWVLTDLAWTGEELEVRLERSARLLVRVVAAEVRELELALPVVKRHELVEPVGTSACGRLKQRYLMLVVASLEEATTRD